MKIYKIKSTNKLNSIYSIINNSGFVVFDIESESLDFKSRIQSIQLATKYKKDFVCFYIPFETINEMRDEPDQELLDKEDAKMLKDGQLTAFDTKEYIVPVVFKEPREEFLHWEDVEDLIRSIFSDDSIKKVAHNMKFDAKFLLHRSMEVNNWHFDTQLALWQTNEKRYSYELKPTVKRFFDIDTPSWKKITNKVRGKYFNLEYSVQQKYACDDCLYTYMLWQKLSPEIFETEKTRFFFKEQMMHVAKTLADMEVYGICVDTDYALRKHKIYAYRLEILNDIFQAMVTKSGYYNKVKEKLSISSDDDMFLLFYGYLKYKKSPMAKEKQVDKFAMKYFDGRGSRLAKCVLLYRKVVGLNKFVDPSLKGSITFNTDKETGILHPHFNQHKTKMHRLSSDDPNTQNIPRGGHIRQCFVASDDYVLMPVDYSQIELRCFAHYSKDRHFLNAYASDNPIDIHEQTRRSIIAPLFPDLDGVEQRTLAKNCNFGIWYGISPWGLAKQLGIGESKATAILSQAFGYYKENKAWVEKVKRFVVDNGYVANCYGGKRRFYNVEWNEIDRGLKEYDLREAVHFVISSTAACILKNRMNIIGDKYRYDPDVNMILQVHDELIIELPKDKNNVVVKDICNILEEPDGIFNVPLKVDYKLLDAWKK